MWQVKNQQNFLILLQESLDKDIDSLVESQDYTFYETPLKKSQKLKEEFRAGLEKLFDLHSLFKKSVDSIKLIQENLHLSCTPVEAENAKKEIRDSDQHFTDYLNQISTGTRVASQENFQQIFQLSNKTLLSIYSLAHYFFNHHDFSKAKGILHLLTCLAPQTSSFWIGLGLCFQQEKHLDEALTCFEIAELLHVSNPEAIIRKIECLLEKKEKKEAEAEYKKLSNLLNNDKKLQSAWKTSLEVIQKKLGTPGS